ncbi:MAG: hypothetical protein IT324_19015 [Anaerolineae bacterium]|nr:hypothetical protein [Anaerolineae bacterium]
MLAFAFATETRWLPRTECVYGPEIAYLDDNVNGPITADDLVAFVEGCISLLRNGPRRSARAAACGNSAKRFTLGNMVRRFSEGIHTALAVER